MSVRSEILNIGRVISVDGSEITVEATKLKVTISENEDTHITVGSFVNCGGDHGDVLCVVTRAWQDLVERQDPENKSQKRFVDIKMIALVVVGTVDVGFRRGVSQLPPVGATAYFITGEVFDSLLNTVLSKETSARLFPVGNRVGTGGGVARFDLDKFFGRHAAVLGTTGSGKSYTVAALAQAVLRSFARPRLVIFDIHNEYSPAFQGEFEQRSTCIGWLDFRLPFWLLTFEEFSAIFTGVLGSNQRAALSDALLEARRESSFNPLGKDNQSISVDTPIPFEWNDLVGRLERNVEAAPSKTDKESLLKMLEKMKSKSRDPRYSFLMQGNISSNDVVSFFEKIFGLGDRDIHVVVLDLSGLPAEVRATAVGVLARLFFDYRYWDAKAENLPVALILEEAHSYIPAESDSKFDVAVQAIERIAKEGRKYGLSLIVVSQRPSNVSQTILSQCGTFVALRLTSDVDQTRVLRLLPDTLGNQGSLLSSLRDGEAVVSGDGITLPGRVQFEVPTPLPGSTDIRFHKAWAEGPPEGYGAGEVISRWLRQTRG